MPLTPIELDNIERRLEEYTKWFERLCDNATGYDFDFALESFTSLEQDVRKLIADARERTSPPYPD